MIRTRESWRKEKEKESKRDIKRREETNEKKNRGNKIQTKEDNDRI